MDLSNFIPPVYRDDVNNVLTKCVSLFEDLLSGRVSSNHNIDDNIETLGKYWDVVRTKSKTKVKEMLDPYGISDIIVSDDITLTKFLYLLPTLYSSKGTYKMFKFILKLCGMDAEIIRWYEDDFLKYQTTRQECAAILILKVGKSALTDDTVSKFNRLIDLLLDVCLVISSMILIKNLEDQVELFDSSVFLFASDVNYDSYSVCEFILNDRYKYKKYIPSSLEFDKTEELRFLTPSQLIRYECSNCSYLYDPVIGYDNNKRIPFSELPKLWVCPVCNVSKQLFSAIETNPIPGLQTLKLALTLIKYSEDYNLFINYIHSNLDTLSNIEIINDAIQFFITNKNYFNIINVLEAFRKIASDLLYLIKSIEEDSYGFLTELGIPVSKAVLSKYFHGMELSPYLLHGNPKTAFKFLTHQFDALCTNLHNNKVFYTYVNTHVTEWKENFFDIRIKHPVMYYNNIGVTHNFEYHRNQYFDLDVRPKKICSNEDYASPVGTYSYPRYMGKLETSVKETIAYSLIEGFYDKTLAVVFRDLQILFPPDFLILVKSILSMFNSSNKTLLPKFCESIPYLINYDFDTTNIEPFVTLFKKVGSDFCYNRELSKDLVSIRDLSPTIPLNASKIKIKFYEIIKNNSFIDGMLILDKITSNLKLVNKTKTTKQIIPYSWRICNTELFFEIDTTYLTDNTFNFILERGSFYYDGVMDHNNKDISYETIKANTNIYMMDIIPEVEEETIFKVVNLFNDDAGISLERYNNKLFYNSQYSHDPNSKFGFNLDYLNSSENNQYVETTLEVINDFSDYQNISEKQICGEHEYYTIDRLSTVRSGAYTYSDFKNHVLQSNYDVLNYNFTHDSNVHRTSYLENERCINGKHIRRSKDGTYLVTMLKAFNYYIDTVDSSTEEFRMIVNSNVSIDHFILGTRDNTYFYNNVNDHSERNTKGISTEVTINFVNNSMSDLYSALYKEYSTHNSEIKHGSLFYLHNVENRNFKYNDSLSRKITYSEQPVMDVILSKSNEKYLDIVDTPILVTDDTENFSISSTLDIVSYRNSTFYYNSLYKHEDFKEVLSINTNDILFETLEEITNFSNYQNFYEERKFTDCDCYVIDRLNTVRSGIFNYSDFTDHSIQNNYSLLNYSFKHDSNVNRINYVENERYINGKSVIRIVEGTYSFDKLKALNYYMDIIDPITEYFISKINLNIGVDLFTSENRDATYFYNDLNDHSERNLKGISKEVTINFINNSMSDLYSALYKEYKTHNFGIKHDSLLYFHNNEDRGFKYNEFKIVKSTYSELPVIDIVSMSNNDVYIDVIDTPILIDNDVIKDSSSIDDLDILFYRKSSFYYNSFYKHNEFREETYVNQNNQIIDSLEVQTDESFIDHNISYGKSKFTYDGSVGTRSGFRTIYSRVYVDGEPVLRSEDHGFEIIKLSCTNNPFQDDYQIVELSYDIDVLKNNSFIYDSCNFIYERNGTFLHNNENSYDNAKRDFVAKFIEKFIITDSLDFRDIYISHDFFEKTECKYKHNSISRDFKYSYQTRVWIAGLPVFREKEFEYEFIKNLNTSDISDTYPISSITENVLNQFPAKLQDNMILNVRGRDITYNSFNKHDIVFETNLISLTDNLTDSFKFSTPSIYYYDSLAVINNKHNNLSLHNEEILYENNTLRIFSCKRGEETSYEFIKDKSNFGLFDELKIEGENLYDCYKNILNDKIDFFPRNSKLDYSEGIKHNELESVPDILLDSIKYSFSDVFQQNEDSINNYRHNGFITYSDINFYMSKCYMKKDHNDIYRGSSFMDSGCIHNEKYQHKTNYNYSGLLDYSQELVKFSELQNPFRITGTEQLSGYIQEEINHNFLSNHVGKGSHNGFKRFNSFEDTERRNL